jgi:hypothetical protein
MWSMLLSSPIANDDLFEHTIAKLDNHNIMIKQML